MLYTVTAYPVNQKRVTDTETYQIFADNEREAKVKARKRYAGEFDLDPADVGILLCVRNLKEGKS